MAADGDAAKRRAVAEGLVQRAEDSMAAFDVESAVGALEAALAAWPECVAALDALSSVLLETGRGEEALPLLRRSAALCPGENAGKWMMIGQLLTGREALDHFARGVAIMDAEAKALQAAEAAAPGALPARRERLRALAREISSGACSMAELYTTDLCFEPEAEAECERLLQLAIGADAANAEAFYALVSLRLIRGRREDAARYLDRCLRLLAEAAERGDDVAEAERGGSADLLVNVAKAAFELERYEEAAHLLEDVQAIVSPVPAEVSYILAFAYHRLEHRAAALECVAAAGKALAAEPDSGVAEALAELEADVRSSTYADRTGEGGDGGDGDASESDEKDDAQMA